jgi:hypothetical protein
MNFFSHVKIILKLKENWYVLWERDVQKWKKLNSFAMSATLKNENEDCKYVPLSIK